MSVPRSAVPTLLVARATDGLRVARVVAGDGGDVAAEAAAVVGAGVAVEVVPGVGGAVASALYAGIPLVTPDARGMLMELGRRFQARLDRLGLPRYRMKVTSALRTDETGFATVANHAFSGAPWRVSRRMDAPARPALTAARRSAVAH